MSPLVRRVIAGNPGPFTADGTCTYLVGRGDVAVIDPGPDLAAHVDAVLAALRPGERLTHLLVTHTHGDHSPAAAPLQARTGAPTYGFGPQPVHPERPADDVVVFGDPEADGPSFASPPPDDGKEVWRPKAGGDAEFVPDVVLAHGDLVEGDGWTLEAVHTPGHASNHLCYGLREEDGLFTGDHVMGWSTSVISPPDGDLRQFLNSLQVLLERPADRNYLPAHGPQVDAPHELVAQYLGHRRRRTEQLLDALRPGPGTIAELVPQIYAQTSKKLWRGAASSVYAHLLHLHELGEVQVEDGPPLRTSRWALTAD